MIQKFLWASVFVFASLISVMASAQQVAVPALPTEEDRIDNARNYFQTGFLLGSGESKGQENNDEVKSSAGAQLHYYYRLNERFLLGFGFSSVETELGDNDERDCSGDLITAQCIAVFGHSKVRTYGLSSIFYFRENGFKKSGPYLSPGIGYMRTENDAAFYRYDQDPGAFCSWVGDCKRLQESGPSKKSTADSTYFKLGAGYQFIWTTSQAVSGHILDLGLNMVYNNKPSSLDVTDSNGTTRNLGLKNLSTALSISYLIVF